MTEQTCHKSIENKVIFNKYHILWIIDWATTTNDITFQSFYFNIFILNKSENKIIMNKIENSKKMS